MTTIQIPSIVYENGKIQKCELVINSQNFNVSYQNNEYNVTQGNLVTDQNNEYNVTQGNLVTDQNNNFTSTIPPKGDNQNNNAQISTTPQAKNETKQLNQEKQTEANKNEYTDNLIELLKKQLK